MALHGHFRNTVPEQDVRKIRKSAAGQEAIVLAFFEAHPNGMHTPYAVQAGTGLHCPITSIRRAITDLTTAGKLVKVDHNRMEQYGVTNRCWKIVKKPAQLELL